mmetsp:Transcript_38603/g.120124  ORF Transcript_38603/g.120124 Transcript_38603/m.120124 type:complete len:384 (-) Transcript_38603:202-1353(-)
MSPKSLPTKRPAAAAAVAIDKPKAKAKPLPAKKCQAIIARLQAAGELPESLQLLLRRLDRGLVAKGKRHISEEAGTSILGKAVRGVESTLEDQERTARAAVHGAGAEEEARAAAQAAAEAQLCDLKQAVVEKKAELTESGKAIEEQKAVVQAARAARSSAEAEVRGSEARKRRLEEVERDSFEPLKDSPASGAGGQKRLTTLRKFGRDHGFHAELLSVLPAVLRRQPDKRRTFDGLCLQQLELEFAKQASSLDAAARDSEMRVARQADELEAAQAAMQEAKERQRTATRELAAAEAALEAGKKSVAEARRHAKRLPADRKLAERRFSLAEARVEKFRRGPLAAYRKAAPPQEASGSPEEAEEPPADEHPTEEEVENEDERPEG